MKQRRRSSGLRQLLIADREYRLPGSPNPPPWSAPRGWHDQLLTALKAGEPVVVSSSLLLTAHIHAGLPDRQYAYGGQLHGCVFVLGSDDRLTLCDG